MIDGSSARPDYPKCRRPGAPLWLLVAADGSQSLADGIFAVSIALFGASTGDPLGLGLVLAARTVPTLFAGLLGGVIADRWKRTTVAAASSAGVALTYVALALLAPTFGLGAPVQVLSLVAGLASALGAPSRYAILPSLVPKDKLLHANAIVRTFRNGGAVVGPLCAGVIFTHAPQVAFWSVSVLVAASSLLIWCIPSAERANAPQSFVQELRGIGPLFRRYRWLGPSILFWAIFLAVFAGASGVLLPMFVETQAGGPTWSVLSAFTAGGYILGSLLALAMKQKTSMLLPGILVSGLCVLRLLPVAITDESWIWLCGAVIGGAAMELSGVFWGTFMQSTVQEEHLGRVSALDYAASFGLLPIGYAAYGVVGSAASDMRSVLVATSLGLLLLVVGTVGYLVASGASRLAQSTRSYPRT